MNAMKAAEVSLGLLSVEKAAEDAGISIASVRASVTRMNKMKAEYIDMFSEDEYATIAICPKSLYTYAMLRRAKTDKYDAKGVIEKEQFEYVAKIGRKLIKYGERK